MAGDLYADAYGDSMEQVNTAVGAVMSSIKGMSTASSADLESVTAKALNFASTFDIEVDRAVQSVGTLINSGLAPNATQAFDLITAASQKVPASLREDVLDDRVQICVGTLDEPDGIHLGDPVWTGERIS